MIAALPAIIWASLAAERMLIGVACANDRRLRDSSSNRSGRAGSDGSRSAIDTKLILSPSRRNSKSMPLV
ncbi:hypothetical protein [Sphingomonas sp. GB1N7]|uniref:hypothetical protein n=1 Tax=Parasphingomonas caseinilytica TaxID=3096158 RepID=UPI002FC7C684